MPPSQRRRARNLGLGLALGFRIGLLASIAWVAGLSQPVFSIAGFDVSWRDLVMLGGGAFLVWKASQEIHREVVHGHPEPTASGTSASFAAVVGEIVVIDAVFSIDSVVVAVGLVEHLPVMIAAVSVAVAVMALVAGPLARFISRNPTTRMLALAFLLVVGCALVADGFHIHFDREPIYAAMAFAGLVEGLNLLRERRRRKRGGQPPAG